MTNMGARFTIGQQVEHVRFNYRGVVFGVDPVFLGSQAWYELMAVTQPPKNAPWYHVMVHGADHTTYVAQRNLVPYKGDDMIDHPLLADFFNGFDNGQYQQNDPALNPHHTPNE